MIPFLAIPVIHSSGAWIASTAAGGYLAGTLSSTWICAFILGSPVTLSTLGIISAGGSYVAASGVMSAAGSKVSAATSPVAKSALTSVSLRSAIQRLGLAPARFLGLTVVGWVVVSVVVSSLGIVYYFSRKKLRKINDERVKGGLPRITWREIYQEAREFENNALIDFLSKLHEKTSDVVLDQDRVTVAINGVRYKVSKLKYAIDKDGSAQLYWSRMLRLKKLIYTVKLNLESGDTIT